MLVGGAWTSDSDVAISNIIIQVMFIEIILHKLFNLNTQQSFAAV